MIIATNDKNNITKPRLIFKEYKNDFTMYDTYYSRLDFLESLPNNTMVLFSMSYGGFYYNLNHDSVLANNITATSYIIKKNNKYYFYWSYYNSTVVNSQVINNISNMSFTRSTSTPSNRCYIFEIR